MTNELRAMCAELFVKLKEWDSSDPYHDCGPLLCRARALLAQPVEEGPTDEELLRMAAEAFGYLFLDGGIGGGEGEFLAFARAALARWGRLTPQPVAVSERLPGPEDCDEQGRCWVFDDQLGLPSWTLIRVQGRSLAPDMYWRPASVMPTPEAND